MTNRAWTLAAVLAASGSALTALALLGLQVGIPFNDLALRSRTRGSSRWAADVWTPGSS